MNGPINNESEKLGKRSKWLERGLILAGLTVVAGLIGETRTISSYLVTIGVAAEVLLGIFITKTAERIQELANVAVAAAYERAANAERFTAEANERTEKERKARTAMLAELKPRHFTASQMDAFVTAITGKLVRLDVFVLVDDPEAFSYALAIMEGLRRARIKSDWYRCTSFPAGIIGGSGVCVYEHPTRTSGIALIEALGSAGQGGQSWATPQHPIADVPSPALFVGRKQTPFAEFPEYFRTPEIPLHRPPWDPE